MSRKKWGPERQRIVTSSEAEPTEIALAATRHWIKKQNVQY